MSVLPGGYPELHAAWLAGADEFRQALHPFYTTLPVYSECGCYMALGDALIVAGGDLHGRKPFLRLFDSDSRDLGMIGDCKGEVAGFFFHAISMMQQNLAAHTPAGCLATSALSAVRNP
jgi:cobyrinic acid a,c-diamide synthase